MPTQHSTVAEFMRSLTSDRFAEVQALREVVLAAHPELVESIKWNSPSYSLDGADLLTVNVAGNGAVRLILHRGATTAEDKDAPTEFTGDPSGLLTWHSNIRASLRMPPLDTLNAVRDQMVAVVRAWVAA